MKLMDRYIAQTFLVNFVILLLVLMSLFVVVDLLVDLDEFIEAASYRARRAVAADVAAAYGLPAEDVEAFTNRRSVNAQAAKRAFEALQSKEEGQDLVDALEPGARIWCYWFGKTLLDYFGPMVVLLYVFFSGLVVVGAMGFTLSGMLHSRELIALIASGISLHRVAAPIMVAGMALSALTLPMQELVIPRLAPKLARGKSQVKQKEDVATFPVPFTRDEQGHLFAAAAFDDATGELTGVTILIRDQDTGLATKRIAARRAMWVEARDNDGVQGWRFPPNTYQTTADLGSVGQFVAPAERVPVEVDFLQSDLSPMVLLARRAAIYSRLLSMGELQAMQDNQAVQPSQRRQIAQIIWSRFSLLVLSVLILVMGLPYFLLRSPQNMLAQGIKAAGVCIGAWGGGLMMLQITSQTLPPAAIAWLPVVIYLPVAAIMMQRVKS